MKIFWRRGHEKLTFNKPAVFFSLGQIGTGKSTLLEHLAMKHHEKGAVIFDIYGSADGENLGWLRSDLAKNAEILLLRGENVDVQTEHDVKLAESLTLKDLDGRYDFVISSRPLYLNRDHEFFSLGHMVNLLYKRIYWKNLVCLLAREASSLWFSRIRVSEAQSDMKNEALTMLREMRHLGISLTLDSLRMKGIDIDLRSRIDFLFVKALGLDGFDKELEWVYKFFDPKFIRSMKSWEFVLLCRTGGLAVGHFPFHSWHKREKENIVKNVGLKIKYGQELVQAKDMGTFKSIGDKEHSEIMSLYAEGYGYNKIHDKLGRSTKSLHDHIHKHNNAVERSGFCAVCRRAGGEYAGEVVKRGKAK
jgi:energy-coupling factor transporter ATP-binding protein EcfA2